MERDFKFRMFKVVISSFGSLELDHVVLAYTGTLSFNGMFISRLKEKLGELIQNLPKPLLIILFDNFILSSEYC